MQIHEMSQRKKLTEVDLVGPSSIFNVGKEVLKDPKSWTDSNALGAAQQRARDQYAKAHAPAVAAKAQANIAPLAKQLAQGWRQIGAQLPSPVTSPTTVPGTAAQKFGQQAVGYKAPTTNAPAGIPGTYKSPIAPTAGSIKKQPTATPAKTAPSFNTNKMKSAPGQPTAADYERLEKRIKQAQGINEDVAGDYRTAFIQYARDVLGARGIDTKAIGFDPATNQELNRILSQITATHQDPDKQQQAVEKYFLTALNKWHEIQTNPAKYKQAFPGGGPSAQYSASNVEPGQADRALKAELDRIGVTGAQLNAIAKLATNAAKGKPTNKTGNPVWDSILKMSGMS